MKHIIKRAKETKFSGDITSLPLYALTFTLLQNTTLSHTRFKLVAKGGKGTLFHVLYNLYPEEIPPEVRHLDQLYLL